MSEQCGAPTGDVSHFYDKDGRLVLEDSQELDSWIKSDTTWEDYHE